MALRLIPAIAFVRAAVALALLLHSGALFALRYGAPEPDPWFSVWVQVEAKSLPPGVGFKRESFPEGDVGYFSNPGTTPFYLVTTPITPPDWKRDLPANMVPDAMAVSGAGFRMGSTRDWVRENFPGILVERFLKADTVRMEGYLGKQKIAIGGRLVRDRVNRLELDSPLPAPLRLAEFPGQPGRFAIANDGPVPLYTGAVFPKPVGWVTEVPFGFLATNKVVAGKTYYGQRNFPSTTDGWQEVERYDARLTQEELETYLPRFKLKQVYKDNRPGNARAPGPQPFEMTAFHGTRKVVIRGRILYDLNPNYDPQASRREAACTSCTGSMCDRCAKDPVRPGGARKAPKHSPTY